MKQQCKDCDRRFLQFQELLLKKCETRGVSNTFEPDYPRYLYSTMLSLAHAQAVCMHDFDMKVKKNESGTHARNVCDLAQKLNNVTVDSLYGKPSEAGFLNIWSPQSCQLNSCH